MSILARCSPSSRMRTSILPRLKKGMSVGSFPVQRQATKLSDLFLVLFLAPSKLRLCVHDLLFMVHLQRYGTRPTGNLRLTILEEYLFNFDETFFSQELTYFLVIVCLSFSLHLLVHACFSQSSSSNWHIFMFYLSVYLCYFLYLGPDAVKLIKMEQNVLIFLVIDLKLLVQFCLVITYLRLSILNSFSQTQKTDCRCLY